MRAKARARGAAVGTVSLAPLLASVLALVPPPSPARADPAVPEPPGYRGEPYRAPVPDTVAGARVVHTEELRRMVARDEAVLIDVLPAPRRPEGMRPDRPWMPPPRRNLPGSLWLPEVGREALSPELEDYFMDRLGLVTAGNKDVPVVFYCLSDCWMSWNATKRARSYGFRNTMWYPEGTDGWAAAGLPLEEARPEPMD